MRRLTRWLSAAGLVLASPVLGAESQATRPLARVAARREANYICLDNRPTLLLWAQKLTDADELEDYQAVGFNTLFVRMSEASEERLQEASALISAAEARGLFAVVALAPTSLSNDQGESLAIDANDEAYTNAVSGFVQAVAKQVGSHPRFIAWLVEAAPPEAVAWGDDGFRAFVQDAYPSIDAVNTSWGSELESWDQVTIAGARDIDSAFPAGLGRASVDFAAYREEAYAKVLSVWAKALRAADPGRLVLASAITDYRSIASVTPDFDGFALNVYPSVAEEDWETHNVQAVDIARRANQFAAVQTLEITGGANPNQIIGWAQLALLHGAAGVAFSDWQSIRGWDGLRQAVRGIADTFANDTGFPQTPRAKTAVLYSPIAGGSTRDGRGLYGYLDGVTPNEPTTLFSMVRNGCRFGQCDVLTVGSLGEVDLGNYGAIIAPMALYLPENSQLALHNFVLRGGALVVDAGVGMYQAEGSITSMPPVLREMLGLRYADLSAPNPADEVSSAGEPGSPGGPGSPGDPGLNPMGPVERGVEVSEDLRKFMDVLEQFLGRTDVTKYLGEAFAIGQGPRLRVRQLGSGFAVYLPMFIYQEWGRDDPLFVDFHREILSRKADVEMIQPDALWPEVEMAVYQGWPIAVSSVGGQTVVVDAFEAESQLYLIPGGAMRLPNPGEDTRTELLFPPVALALAHPIPIYLRPQAEGAVVTAAVTRYDAEAIELVVHGTGAEVNATAGGLRISGGESTPVEIEVRGGAYSLERGSMHHLVITDTPRGRPRVDQVVMPNADTGSLVISTLARATRITIEKAPQEQ